MRSEAAECARAFESARAADLEHAIRAGDAERLWILVTLPQNREGLLPHLAVAAGTFEDGSTADAHRM